MGPAVSVCVRRTGGLSKRGMVTACQATLMSQPRCDLIDAAAAPSAVLRVRPIQNQIVQRRCADVGYHNRLIDEFSIGKLQRQAVGKFDVVQEKFLRMIRAGDHLRCFHFAGC